MDLLIEAGGALLRTNTRVPAPVFAEVRERVVQDWTTDRSEELNEQFYASLRDRYTVVIEEPSEEGRVAAVKSLRSDQETPD